MKEDSLTSEMLVVVELMPTESGLPGSTGALPLPIADAGAKPTCAGRDDVVVGMLGIDWTHAGSRRSAVRYSSICRFCDCRT